MKLASEYAHDSSTKAVVKLSVLIPDETRGKLIMTTTAVLLSF
jgi:hypothetical protein